MPQAVIEAGALENGIGILDLLSSVKMIPSKGEGRRLVQQGGISINGEKVTAIDFVVAKELFEDGKIIVKKGKKSFLKIIVE